MAVAVKCQKCGRKYRAKDELLGKRVNCPACKQTVVIDGERAPNHDVFISHSSKDKKLADAVCVALEAQRIRCWIAPRDIEIGNTFGSAIIQAINDCKIMVLLVSGSAILSRHVITEIERAFSKGVQILSVRIDDVVLSEDCEYFLSASPWLDALTPPMEELLKRLADRAKHLLSFDSAIDNTKRSPSKDGREQSAPVNSSKSPIGVLRELKFRIWRRPSATGWAIVIGIVCLLTFVGFAITMSNPGSENAQPFATPADAKMANVVSTADRAAPTAGDVPTGVAAGAPVNLAQLRRQVARK